MKWRLTIAIVALMGSVLMAQQQGGTVRISVRDSANGEAMPFTAVLLESGTFRQGGMTDPEGVINIKPVPPGTYKLTVSALGYGKRILDGVRASANGIAYIDVNMRSGQLDTVEITWNQKHQDLLGIGTPSVMTRIGPDELLHNASPRGINGAITSTVPRASQPNEREGLHLSGSRSGSTLYLIDGIKVIGEPQIPQTGIEEMMVITAGVPAQYGDTTSGVVLIQTRSFR